MKYRLALVAVALGLTFSCKQDVKDVFGIGPYRHRFAELAVAVTVLAVVAGVSRLRAVTR